MARDVGQVRDVLEHAGPHGGPMRTYRTIQDAVGALGGAGQVGVGPT